MFLKVEWNSHLNGRVFQVLEHRTWNINYKFDYLGRSKRDDNSKYGAIEMPTLNNTFSVSYIKDEIKTKTKPIKYRNSFKKQGKF